MRIRPRALPVVSCLTLALAASALAGGRVVHDLQVHLQPDVQRLGVVDRITLPEAPVGGTVDFMLDDGLSLSGSNVPVEEVPLGDLAAFFGLTEAPEQPHLKRYRARVDGTELRLEYSGSYDHGLGDQKEEYTRGFRSTRGIVAPEGVFLSGSSGWYPAFGPELVEFRMTVRKPAGWHVISQGEGTSSDGTTAHWDSQGPMDDIYLVGGPLVVFEDQAGAVRTFVYLHEPDASLAARYLEATARYLEMYRGLIGPHAYSKFALVENFWETGYGMPSFTLLGPQVIRFPFILTSSYPHEILHDWWGNSVFVDHATGNWCEGLTAYLADHLLQAQRGRAAEYRRNTLQKYRDYVKDGRDFPLVEFRSRHDAATEAVGYGKTLMGFHALRLSLGDDDFRRLLATFYRQFRGERAAFRDIQALAEEISERDFDRFFDDWTERPGAARLELRSARARRSGDEWQVTVRLRQTQDAEPFFLDVPVVVQTEGEPVHAVLRSEDREARLRIATGSPPVAVHVDPRFDVFRLLDPRETPPSLGQVFGEPRILAVLPSDAPEDEREGYRKLVEAWRSEDHDVEVVLDSEMDALPADRTGWLLGRQNRLAASAFGERAGAVAEGGAVTLGADRLELAGHSLVVMGRHPDDVEKAVGWIVTDVAAAIPGLIRKLPHYGKYSYLGFAGDEPTNVVKGQWPTSDSPLTADLRPRSQRDAPLPAFALEAREPLADLPPAFSSSRLGAHVRWLADEAREGRGIGSAGLAEAEGWVAERFGEIGLEPGGDDGTYLQRFTVARGPDGNAHEVSNVVGILRGTRDDWTGQSALLVAHLDHLGRGWPDVHSGDEGVVHPGADDNASGVAVLVEVARAMAAAGRPERSLVFVAFNAEEAGRLGSRHFVEQPSVPLNGVRAVINLDTVGRLGGGKIQVIGTDTATEWPHLFRGVGFVTGIEHRAIPPALESSDHASFVEKGIPAVQLFTGAHGDYHRPGDVAEDVDVAGLVKVATFVKESMAYLSSRPDPLTVTIAGPPASAQPTPSAPTDGGGRKVGFGMVPDFAHAGPGVRVELLVEGSPAERAGVRPGDLLLALDDREITSLRQFAGLLKVLEPGTTVQARLKRGDAELTLPVTLVAR